MIDHERDLGIEVRGAGPRSATLPGDLLARRGDGEHGCMLGPVCGEPANRLGDDVGADAIVDAALATGAQVARIRFKVRYSSPVANAWIGASK